MTATHVLAIEVTDELNTERRLPLVPLADRLRGRVRFSSPVYTFQVCGCAYPAGPAANEIAIFLTAYDDEKAEIALPLPVNKRGRHYFYPQRIQPNDTGHCFVKSVSPEQPIASLVIDLIPWTLSRPVERMVSDRLLIAADSEGAEALVSLDHVRMIVGDAAVDLAFSQGVAVVPDAGGEWRMVSGHGWKWFKP